MSDKKKWAVVHDGATRYVGVIDEGDVYSPVIRLSDAFKLVLLEMPQQVPGGRGVAIAMAVRAMPIGLAGGLTFIYLSPSAIELFSDMSEHDRATYEKLVADASKSFLERRAEASGISLATNVPKG